MRKKCLRCKKTKPIDEFGRNVCNVDQRNVYCKKCVRDRAVVYRLAARARAAGMVRKTTSLPADRQELTPAVVAPLVLEAIDRAPAPPTQGQLLRYAREHLPAEVRSQKARYDLIEMLGQALGWLFDERAIATSGSCEQRIYFRRC